MADYETEYNTRVDDKLAPSTPHRNPAVPESYLVNNYPNPFNPSTTINFFISKEAAGQTKLIKIYNALGQLVAVIDVTHYAAGFHSIQFDGMDYFGNPLPSGQYFVRLHVGDQISTLRITLQK